MMRQYRFMSGLSAASPGGIATAQAYEQSSPITFAYQQMLQTKHTPGFCPIVGLKTELQLELMFSFDGYFLSPSVFAYTQIYISKLPHVKGLLVCCDEEEMIISIISDSVFFCLHLNYAHIKIIITVDYL